MQASLVDFASWLLFAVTGRLIVYVWFLFPLPPFMKLPYWLEKLHSCDLCSGVWAYGILAVALHVDIFARSFGVPQNIVSEIATGIVTSYLVHIFVIGVKEKYSPPIVI